jgi:Protein of unknown function (DUF2637)
VENPTDTPPPPASTRIDWDRAAAVAPQAVTLAIVGAGAVITSAISYQHEYALARNNGQIRWVSLLVPFSLDGMILVAGVALLWAALNRVTGWRQLWQPRGVLSVGIITTIAANLFSDYRVKWLGPAVSASSGVALVLMSAVAFWLVAEHRKKVRGDDPQPAADCSCPPPPLTVAEALPLARARLRDAGELHGEQVLADRFGVSRDRVRKLLLPQSPELPEPSQNGSAS